MIFHLPKDVGVTFSAAGLFALLFFSAVTFSTHFGNPLLQWESSLSRGGDLIQHYAAGILWKNNDISTIYENDLMGEWINRNSITPSQIYFTNYNYSYPPIIAWMASKLIAFPYSSWILPSLITNLSFYAIILVVLFYGKTMQVPTLFMLLGFPSLYYTLLPFQNSILTLLILVAASLAMNRGHLFLGGLIISLTFYKPQFAPYLTLFLLLAGHWKPATGIVAGGIFWTLLSIGLCGMEAHWMWIDSLGRFSSGEQFMKIGLDQSWQAFIAHIFPASTNFVKTIVTIAGLIMLSLTAVLSRKLKLLQAGDTLFLAATLWIIASPYVGFYELLVGIGWWLWIVLHVEWSRAKRILTYLFWLACLFSISGAALDSNLTFTAPLMTIWAFGSLFLLNSLSKRTSESRFI